jgi:DNA-binding CsgD family transcriptional regulator
MQYFTAFDSTGIIVWQSPTARGYSRSEMVGTPAWKWVEAKDIDQCKRTLSTAIVTRHRESFVHVGTRDGNAYEVAYIPLPMSATVIAEVKAVSTHTLTDREMQVLEAIFNDETPQELSKRLEISISTIESYRASLKRKLNAKGNSGLVRAAIRMGLLSP